MLFKNELFNLYQNLINQLYVGKDLFQEEHLVLWSSILGKEYDQKLMIVGRAGNGGEIYIDKTIDQYKEDSFNELMDNFEKGLDWVINSWGVNEGEYNPKKSAFWRISKKLSDEIIEDSVNVLNRIAYSNLYKVANYSGGNPSSKLMNVQFELCREILLKEIELYKPAIIIFLTGWSWAKWFLPINSKNHVTNFENKFVEFSGKLNTSLVIVGQHPQGKPELEHFNEIIHELENLKNCTLNYK